MLRARDIIESAASLFSIDERFVLNTDEIGDFVDSWKSQTDDPDIQKWFAANFRRWLINDCTLTSVVPPDSIPDSAPEWVHKAVSNGVPIFNVDFQYLKEESIENVIQFFQSKDRPNDISRLDVLSALNAAEKWADLAAHKEREERDPVENVEEIWQDGDMKWVRIITREGLDREGKEMHHCVSGHFFNNGTLFSLRDKNNKPHFTLLIDNSDNLDQAKGYTNKAIEPQYRDSLMNFLNNYSEMSGVTKQGRGDLDMNDLHWDDDNSKVAEGSDGSYWETRLLDAVRDGNEHELRQSLYEVMDIYEDTYYEVLDGLKIDDCWIMAYAARKHDWAIVMTLAEVGSMDLRAEDPKNGFTPLFYAAEDDDFETFKWLLKEINGYNGESDYLAEETNKSGETILGYVMEQDLGVEWIEELLRYNSELTGVVDKKGRNLLHIACLGYQLSLINEFTAYPRHDIDINRKDHDGNTPIVYLVDHNDTHTMDMLVKRGAEIHSIASILLKRAKKHARPEVMKWLEKQGITEEKEMVKSSDVLKKIGEIYGTRRDQFFRSRRGSHSKEGSYGGKTVGDNLSHDLGDLDSIWTVWKNLGDDMFLEYLMKILKADSNVKHNGKDFSSDKRGDVLSVSAEIDDDGNGGVYLAFDSKKGSLEVSYSIEFAADWDSGSMSSPPEPRSTLEFTDSAFVWSSKNLEDVVSEILTDMMAEASSAAEDFYHYDPDDQY
jgi:hypothetical protein